jgi:hypothetical protein
MNRCWVIRLRCPYQGDHPSNKRPAQKEIQEKDREFVPFAAGKGNDRGKEVEDEPEAEKGGKMNANAMA